MTLSKAKQNALTVLSIECGKANRWVTLGLLQKQGVQRQTLRSLGLAGLVTFEERAIKDKPAAGKFEMVQLTADGRTEITDMEKQGA